MQVTLVFVISNKVQCCKQNKTKQNKTKQNKTKQNKTKQNKTKKLNPAMFVVCGQEYQKSLKSPFQLYEPTSLVYPGVNHPGKLKEKKRFSRNIYISINFFF